MISSGLLFDVITRIKTARLARCGGDLWVRPPSDWPAIVQLSWPGLWEKEPSRVPEGWVDVVMAFSEHVLHLGGEGLKHDAFENPINGRLVIQRFYDDDRNSQVFDASNAYEFASLTTCRVCGGPGRPWQHAFKSTKILCDDHAGERR